jgi:hypothetical protein
MSSIDRPEFLELRRFFRTIHSGFSPSPDVLHMLYILVYSMPEVLGSKF